MPYASVAARRAVQRAHYAAHKSAYNPGRLIAATAYKAARAKLLCLSNSKFLMPSEVGWTIDGCVDDAYNDSDERRAGEGLEALARADGVYKLARTWCMRTLPGCAEGGLLAGSSPFFVPTRYGTRPAEPWNDWARDEFIRRLPKGHCADGRIELLILNITLKRIKLYGR